MRSPPAPFPPKKDKIMISPIEEEIQAHTEKVKTRQIRCDLEVCPRCEGVPGFFNLHDVRERTFLVIFDRLVRTILSLLPRWKCPLCGKTFTGYPPFAVRYKRYVRETVMESSRRYVEDDRMTYREGVCKNCLPIFHDCEAEDEIDDRTLAPSTLHRWITTLGGLAETLRASLKLIGSKSSGIFRKVFPASSRKHRTEDRKALLEDCLRLLLAEEEYSSLFGVSIFPRLATACLWK